jgi:hypothetical protein
MLTIRNKLIVLNVFITENKTDHNANNLLNVNTTAVPYVIRKILSSFPVFYPVFAPY